MLPVLFLIVVNRIIQKGEEYMKQNRTKLKNTYSTANSVIYGVILAFVISVILTLLVSVGVRNGIVDNSASNKLIAIIHFGATFCGCLFALNLRKEKTMLIAILELTGCVLLNVLLGVILGKIQLNYIGSGIVSMTLGVVGAFVIKLVRIPKKNYARKYI